MTGSTKRFPKSLPREFHWTLYQDTPKHRWADIAYLLAEALAARSEDGMSAMEFINQTIRSIEVNNA